MRGWARAGSGAGGEVVGVGERVDADWVGVENAGGEAGLPLVATTRSGGAARAWGEVDAVVLLEVVLSGAARLAAGKGTLVVALTRVDADVAR